ncbi:MAG TPA: GNAT family N-acetyltransferase [Pyrinomonadaceae bacterium]|nr:GNAT family N-acetyltransferase [Pyrinomonadaceae bacterium]
MAEPTTFTQAESPEQVAEARELFLEYANWLGFSLCFQNFDKELAELPGAYAPPKGRLLLASQNGETAGCVALRPILDGACEMKRLYVRPAFRGQGLGRALAVRIVEEARALGYGRMFLDTISDKMGSAIKVYRSLGFEEVEPYYHNPVEGATFMELKL